ncbi:DUF305 domain-containing protein [Klenkia taihuensis]|uniref:Uncharacterized conserved protein, DUF305 family n=1 Tax=Klenkia taihuensis TaxID=1225127 RepID=A0A1I1N797_9ACTN|nr:DUF305 domain-containing protein [Klenkia taihuensis]GHE12160.1 hypothetical protein GCM10011381_28840 [Klenkia taihuensis]SFC93561.1 Uncharacterized conserved protein, DUF305 family [Klenkia taihuensis]
MRFTLPSRTSHRRTIRLAGVLLAGGLALAACSGGDDQPASSSSVPADATFNAADVTFAQDMVPHHEQAVEMAELVPDRSTDPRVIDLAQRIEAAQGPEIDMLNGWLQDWGASSDDEDGGHSGMDHSGMDHGGMMSEEDMSALEGASGIDFDRMWLQMMLEHHTGAVGMAQTEITDGEDADAVAMAQDIRDSQSAEITEMEQLLQDLSTQ